MRVLILVSSSQKGALANKLIQHPDLSKVVLTPFSKKFIKEAQAVIVYYESEKDADNLSDFIAIYKAVPLFLYLGN